MLQKILDVSFQIRNDMNQLKEENDRLKTEVQLIKSDILGLQREWSLASSQNEKSFTTSERIIKKLEQLNEEFCDFDQEVSLFYSDFRESRQIWNDIHMGMAFGFTETHKLISATQEQSVESVVYVDDARLSELEQKIALQEEYTFLQMRDLRELKKQMQELKEHK